MENILFRQIISIKYRIPSQYVGTVSIFKKSFHTLNYKEIINKRRTTRKFLSKDIPHDLMYEVLRDSQTAPSSFNLQPYKVILVKSEAQKSSLASAMLGGNADCVLSAPLTAIILADKCKKE